MDGHTEEAVVEQDQDFEAPEGLEDRYEQTIRQTVKILEDSDDRPEGIYLSIHRGDSVGFTTGMSPELVDGVGPTLPAVDMLAQHLLTVCDQTSGMGLEELALLAANHAKKIDGEGGDQPL